MIGILTKRENTEQKKGHKLFIALMCLFVAMFFVRNIFEIEFPVILYLPVLAIIALVSTKTELLSLVLAIIPFGAGFQIKYGFLICAIIYIVKFGKSVKKLQYALVVVLMFVWELLHAFAWDFSLFESLRNFSELIVLALFFISEGVDYDDDFMMRIFAYCSLIAASIVFIINLKYFQWDMNAFLEAGQRFGEGLRDEENFSFSFNPNSLGLASNMGIMGLLMLINNKRAKLLDYIVFILLIAVGLLTMSRSFIICLVLILLYYFVFQSGTLKKKVLSIAGLALLFVAIILVATAVAPDIMESYAKRFMVDDITNGRDVLLTFYNDHIMSGAEYLLFGVGLQNYGDKVNRIHNTNMNVSHNAYQELIVVWGIVGLALFIYLICCLIKRAKENSSKMVALSYLPIGLFLFKLMSGQFISSGVEILYLALIFVYMCYPQKEQIRRQVIGKE